MVLQPLRKGSEVSAGTLLGTIGKTDPQLAPHLTFSIRPAGKHSPRIYPKPILDGWKLFEATAIYRAAGQDPFTQNGPKDIAFDLDSPSGRKCSLIRTAPSGHDSASSSSRPAIRISWTLPPPTSIPKPSSIVVELAMAR